ncbi:hypothetical protein PF006_g22036 [Phytophthora fragariae]|uniref:Uncharacterized protein n=1 Tax=Phytophthora fragariae TaxID=53985 RepID=A0A6A3RUQ3_9STRA|nr:hypothetical protein PF003_g21279 [Phytophthora fragariae]KAE9103989.1 hypothetical protein PF006_g22036 [Phytophthora fragariae]
MPSSPPARAPPQPAVLLSCTSATQALSLQHVVRRVCHIYPHGGPQAPEASSRP